MSNGNEVKRILSLEGITPEFLEAFGESIMELDKRIAAVTNSIGFPQEPTKEKLAEMWEVLPEWAAIYEAMQGAPKLEKVFDVADRLVRVLGPRAVKSLAFRFLVMGWQMAEAQLQSQQLERLLN